MNHSGPAANPMLSDVYNMRTNMVMFTDQGGKTKLNKLKRTQQVIESNIRYVARQTRINCLPAVACLPHRCHRLSQQFGAHRWTNERRHP